MRLFLIMITLMACNWALWSIATELRTIAHVVPACVGGRP